MRPLKPQQRPHRGEPKRQVHDIEEPGKNQRAPPLAVDLAEFILDDEAPAALFVVLHVIIRTPRGKPAVDNLGIESLLLAVLIDHHRHHHARRRPGPKRTFLVHEFDLRTSRPSLVRDLLFLAGLVFTDRYELVELGGAQTAEVEYGVGGIRAAVFDDHPHKEESGQQSRRSRGTPVQIIRRRVVNVTLRHERAGPHQRQQSQKHQQQGEQDGEHARLLESTQLAQFVLLSYETALGFSAVRCGFGLPITAGHRYRCRPEGSMTPIVLLVATMLPAAPPGETRAVPLRLERGQEFVYHAVYNQDSDRPGSHLTRLLDTHVLILEVTPQGAQAALMTVMRVENKQGEEPVPVVRVEYARINPYGRVTFDPTSPLPYLPIDGPPSLDPLPFIELPARAPEPHRAWEGADVDQVSLGRRLLVAEFHPLDRCWKIKSEQSSGNWNVAGRTVWKREEMAWMSLQHGFVVRLERTTEWRTESGERWKSSLIADLDGLPAEWDGDSAHLKERKAEIKAAVDFAKELNELTKPRGEPDYRGYTNLLHRLDRYVSRETPYAVAMKSLRRRTELARSGERPPDPLIIRTQKESPRPVEEDQPLPDFTANDFGGGPALHSASLKGRPSLLIFFKPKSPHGAAVLRYAEAATIAYVKKAQRVNVVLLAAEGDSSELAKLRSERQLEVPIYDGRAVIGLFSGRSTPRVIVLDKAATVKTVYSGWNGEFKDLIHKELLKLID